MADISQIQVGSTVYNIKDTTARNNSSGAAPLASPAFTGSPTAPTPAKSTNSTRLATTEFVHLLQPLSLVVPVSSGQSAVTYQDERITSSMVPFLWSFTNHRYIPGDVNITTSNGSLTIASLAGNFTGAASIRVWMVDANL